MPVIVESDALGQVATIVVRGSTPDGPSEWSFGEAAPKNNKNAYPYAMAEKRAKDRVILKLIGLHGIAYSEEEADDFKPSAAQLKKDGKWEQLQAELEECQDPNKLQDLWAQWADKEFPAMTKKWREQAEEAFEKRAEELRPDTDAKVTYVEMAFKMIDEAGSVEDLEGWWLSEKTNRAKYGLTESDVDELKSAAGLRKKTLLLGAG
jgi:hypothetical protein